MEDESRNHQMNCCSTCELTEEHLGKLFRMIHNGLHRLHNKRMECHNLTSPQAEILIFLMHVPGQQATQKQIEQYMKLTNPTVTGLLNRLEEKKYVKRMVNPKDKRSHIVVLTDESRKILSAMWEEIHTLDQKLTEGMTQEERKQLFGYLKIVLHNIS